MSTDTDTDDTPKKGRCNWNNCRKGEIKRTVELAAVQFVEKTLEYEAPERLWDRNRFIAQKAIDLAKKSDIDGDVIARALLRLLVCKDAY